MPTFDDMSQKEFGDIWASIHPNSRVLYTSNVEQALDTAREIGTATIGMHTLITGSQHLVGSTLFSLDRP